MVIMQERIEWWWWVRARFIVYVNGMQERLQESKTESIMRNIPKAKRESMLRQTCFMQHARTTKRQSRHLDSAQFSHW
jgi:hypothetical protein